MSEETGNDRLGAIATFGSKLLVPLLDNELRNIAANLRDARARIAMLEAALAEISGYGCYRTNATAGPAEDCYDHLSACVNVACAALFEPSSTGSEP